MISFRTHSRIEVNLENPDPDTILLVDIIHALSNINRFCGHTESFYSVAQHSVNLSWCVPPRYRLEALLHDASEAYLHDISGPLKHSRYLEGYRELEAQMQSLIFEKFGVEPTQLVRDIDHMLSYDELDILILGKGQGALRHGFLRPIFTWDCRVAKERFSQALRSQL